jgi:hypothetical protein
MPAALSPAPDPAPVEPDPEPEVTPEPVPAVGEVITTDAQAAAAQQAGLGVHVASDGTRIVVDPLAPLPDAVVADVKASTPGQGPATKRDASRREQDLVRATDAIEATGKYVLYVLEGAVFDMDGTRLSTDYRWVTEYPALNTQSHVYATAAEALAGAQAAVAAQPDPARFEIINLLD